MAALTLLVLREYSQGNEHDRIVTSDYKNAGDNERDTDIASHYAVPANSPLHRSPPVIIRQTQVLVVLVYGCESTFPGTGAHLRDGGKGRHIIINIPCHRQTETGLSEFV